MSVRATGALIGDPVYVTALSDSPRMIVTSVDADAKLITTIWFSDNREAQEGVFPASSLDRVEVKAPQRKKPASTTKTADKKK
jgi:hypothetical protein